MENNVRLKISGKYCRETDYKGPKFLCTSQWRHENALHKRLA